MSHCYFILWNIILSLLMYILCFVLLLLNVLNVILVVSTLLINFVNYLTLSSNLYKYWSREWSYWKKMAAFLKLLVFFYCLLQFPLNFGVKLFLPCLCYQPIFIFYCIKYLSLKVVWLCSLLFFLKSFLVYLLCYWSQVEHSKLFSHSIICVFLSYGNTQKGYYWYDLTNHKFYVSHHVVIF